MRKTRAKCLEELDYIIKNLFLRIDSDNMPKALKEKRISKIIDLLSLGTPDLEKLS